MSDLQSDSDADLPSITVSAEIWDATLAINKAIRLTEKLDFPVSIHIRRHKSVVVIVVLTALVTTVSTQILTNFTNDLYGYLKKRIIKALKKGRKMQIDTNEQWETLGKHQPQEKPTLSSDLLEVYPQQICPNCHEPLPTTALLSPGIFIHEVCGKEVTISERLVLQARRDAEEKLKQRQDKEAFLRGDVKRIRPRLSKLTSRELEYFENRVNTDLRTIGQMGSLFSGELLSSKRSELEKALLDIKLEKARRRPSQ